MLFNGKSYFLRQFSNKYIFKLLHRRGPWYVLHVLFWFTCGYLKKKCFLGSKLAYYEKIYQQRKKRARKYKTIFHPQEIDTISYEIFFKNLCEESRMSIKYLVVGQYRIYFKAHQQYLESRRQQHSVQTLADLNLFRTVAAARAIF